MSRKSQEKRQRPPKYITESMKVEKFIPGGQALATLENGKKIFLWNALPGEIVTKVRVTKEKSSFVEGIAEEIAQKSEHRIEPKDACYLATSPWQILTEEYEEAQKDEVLREIFRQHDIGIPEALRDFHIMSDGNYYHYRNKMEYALYYSHEDERIHLAFHERGTHRKVPVEQSSLEMPEIWQRAQEIIDELNHANTDARSIQSILLRCDQNGKVSGGILANGHPHPIFPQLKDELFGVTYSYSPNGFFQINLPVYAQTLQAISQRIKARSILDLYSGVGTIGYSVAILRPTAISRLTLVESNGAAYQEMFHNNQTFLKYFSSHIPEEYQTSLYDPQEIAHPILAKSEEALDYIERDQVVIVDPPRAGCMPEVIERFLEVEPEQIVYLSCNPATQARDIKKLLEKYQISFFQPYNFFPRTPHIENLVILQRKD